MLIKYADPLTYNYLSMAENYFRALKFVMNPVTCLSFQIKGVRACPDGPSELLHRVCINFKS